ncbi:MAG TPA: hypothetical protein VFT50_00745 [Baekduia sp.]|nr:hypothetical protein [Baekduia sp.]
MLADNDTGRVRIGRKRLSERIGRKDPSAATRALRELREVRAVVVVTPGRGGRGRSDEVAEYQLDEAALVDVPDLSDRGAEAANGFGLKGGQMCPERGAVAAHLPTQSPTRPGQAGRARAREAGATNDEVVDPESVVSALADSGLPVNAGRVGRALAESPRPDAVAYAEQLADEVKRNGGHLNSGVPVRSIAAVFDARLTAAVRDGDSPRRTREQEDNAAKERAGRARQQLLRQLEEAEA